jgi:hypothetical protein
MKPNSSVDNAIMNDKRQKKIKKEQEQTHANHVNFHVFRSAMSRFIYSLIFIILDMPIDSTYYSNVCLVSKHASID